MKNNFVYECTRRCRQSRLGTERSIVFGAGSGGDDPEVDGARMVTAEKTLVLSGNHVAIQADDPTPPATAETPLITLLASDMTCMQGRVEMHAPESIRISTSGGIGGPRMHQLGTDGVEVQVGETQEIFLRRGMLPTDNYIQLDDSLMALEGGVNPIVIESDTNITIQVANGTSSITLTPMGIVMQGPIIKIN
jgi:hypothetical protein